MARVVTAAAPQPAAPRTTVPQYSVDRDQVQRSAHAGALQPLAPGVVPGGPPRRLEVHHVQPRLGPAGDVPAAAALGVRLELVKLPAAKRGFVLLPRRWVVETTQS